MKYLTFTSLLLLLGANFLPLMAQETATSNDVAQIQQPPPRVQFRKSPLVLTYVEVNDQSLLNAAAYKLEDGKPLIDLAIIFAANINRNAETGEPELFCNENVQFVLDNHKRIIAPLQAQKIRVSLSLLGNHQGVGLANFQSREQAKNFAQQVADLVEEHGLDGVDLDDEFAKYGQNGGGKIQSESLLWFLEELRALMPEKLISYYFIGPTTKQLKSGEKQAGDYLDFAWQAYYSKHRKIEVPGLEKSQLSFSAMNISQAKPAKAAELARKTKADELGAFMLYNLQGQDQLAQLQEVAQGLYGQDLSLAVELVQQRALAQE